MPKTKAKTNGAHAPHDDEGPAPIGDNLTEAQEAKALRIYHVSKLRGQMVLVDRAKSLYDAERQSLTDLFHLAKADTHYSRKEMRGLLDAMKMNRVELIDAEQKRAALWSDWDLPVGTQLDLFERMPREVQDEAHAKGMGYAAGLRGDACQMPDEMEPRFGPSFGEGWNKGQEELAWALSAVGRIVDRRKGANSNPVALQPEPEDVGAGDDSDHEGPTVPEAWAEPSHAEAEAAFEPA